MDELISLLLNVQSRIEEVITRIDAGVLTVIQAGTRAADGQQNYLALLRAQRDDLDKAIALARNPQRKAY